MSKLVCIDGDLSGVGNIPSGAAEIHEPPGVLIIVTGNVDRGDVAPVIPRIHSHWIYAIDGIVPCIGIGALDWVE